MLVTDDDFAYVQSLVRERAAIVLDDSKRYLVETRLPPLVRDAGFSSIEGLIAEARACGLGPLSDRVVDAMTTNETSWLRDTHPFEVLIGEVLPRVASTTTGPIQIWSAACSSGQEPYGLAMLIVDALPHLRSRVRILGTDISQEMLIKAKRAEYSQIEANRGMEASMLMRHFTRAGALWRVNDDIRSMVEFRQHNLARSFVSIPTCDIVLMRNVLIYFDSDAKQKILRTVATKLAPGGWLILGSTETTVGVDGSWERTRFGRTTMYQQTGS